MKVHLVLYSDGEPFDTAKNNIIKSANFCSERYTVVVHSYDLKQIKKLDWFSRIQDLPSINMPGKRDGYYCAYKAFCTWDVYRTAEDGDIIYYVDSSQYYTDGFTETIDALCDVVVRLGFVAGSMSDDARNNGNDYTCPPGCDNFVVWKKVWPDANESVLSHNHILASWFILQKSSDNDSFMNDYVNYCVYKDDDLPLPLLTYHHTGDQSIFNMLVHKYNLHVFYDKPTNHNENKNKNHVLKVINSASDSMPFFVRIG
jgi:hypothetical protein